MKSIAANSDFRLTTGFLLLLIAAAVSRNPFLLFGFVLLALYIVLANVGAFSRFNVRERCATLLLVASLTLILPISVFRNGTAVIHYCVALVSLGCAFILTRNLTAYLAASVVSLIVVQLTLCAYVLMGGIDKFPLDHLFNHTSSNGITSCLILLQVNYSLMKFLIRRSTSLLTALLTLAICVVGFGRGSILAGAAIVGINLLAVLSWRNRWKTLMAVLLLSGVGIAMFAMYWDDVAAFIRGSTKIGAGLYDQARERMILEYLQRIDAATLITGADYRGTSIVTDFSGNPHNSYIRAHHIFGLPYLMSVLLFPLLLSWGRRGAAVTAYSACMLGVVLLRSFTEPLLFPTPFDFYFFALCFALSMGIATQKLQERGAPVRQHAGMAQSSTKHAPLGHS